MGKPLAALLLLLSLIHLSNGQTNNAREQAGLLGPVKSVHLETSKIQERDGQPVESGRNLESVIRYDERGNEIEKTIYFNGVFQSKSISTSDEQGRTETHHNAAGAITGRSIVKVGKWGRTLEYAIYNSNGSLLRRSTYLYDQHGRLREQFRDDASPALSYRIVYSYDDTGQFIGQRYYDANNVLKQEVESNGVGAKVVAYNGDGSIEHTENAEHSRVSFEYDARRNWIKRSHGRTIVKSNETIELVEVIYRKITYH